MMYYAVNKLDAEKFARLDFTINFGLEPHNRKAVTELMVSNSDYNGASLEVFSKIPTF